MKKTTKKLTVMLLFVVMIATIGAVFVSAQNNGTTKNFTTPPEKFLDRCHMNGPKPFNNNSIEHGLFFYNLTEEQQTELDKLVKTLKDQGANSSQIQAAIQEKLDEYGVLDQRLDNEINQTKQRLQILNRQKELREQGYSWDKIKTIIQDEFGIEDSIAGGDYNMMGGQYGFGCGPCEGPRGFTPGEKSDQ